MVELEFVGVFLAGVFVGAGLAVVAASLRREPAPEDLLHKTVELMEEHRRHCEGQELLHFETTDLEDHIDA